jgi:RNA polymerase sigma-70 factor (ECF subfamily)
VQVLEITDGKITGINSFLDTPALFPLFGLPLTLEAADTSGEQAADR